MILKVCEDIVLLKDTCYQLGLLQESKSIM